MSEHTPGPWVVADDAGQAIVTLASVEAGDVVIATLPKANHANAHVMAAALDLLEVVEQGVTFFLIHSDDCDMVDEVEGACPCGALQVSLKATAALAKARGGQKTT